MDIKLKLAEEFNLRADYASNIVDLIGEGNTIPFIARYRKEMHGNLDEVAIGKIQERLTYYTELEARKETILKSIADQEKLTPELEKKIRECYQKSALEDLYQPYKPKRRTRAQVAKEKGFGPLAESIWSGDEAAALAASEENLQCRG